MSKEVDKGLNSKNLKDNYKKILTVLSPAIPHFASECLEDLEIKEDIYWPNANKKYLSEDTIEYVIQINGKKKSILNLDKEDG